MHFVWQCEGHYTIFQNSIYPTGPNPPTMVHEHIPPYLLLLSYIVSLGWPGWSYLLYHDMQQEHGFFRYVQPCF